ncbi:MAG: deoxyribodipyrimidine photo-lyase [Geodermatophilaceae bacterium]|nr:deoxyribodipyrimidine photo-lyase [Geodermatophilaceae bacterium]
MPNASIMWFRRDLRLGDNPALLAARDAADGGPVVPVFVLDPALWTPSGPPRQAFLISCLAHLDKAMGGRLVVRRGSPATVLPHLAAKVGASSVHIAADTGPYGRRRDEAVAKALGDIDVDLVSTGSAYAVTPGRITKPDGEPYRVFTPFAKAWRAHGWRAPAITPRSIPWATGLDSDPLPDAPERNGLRLPAPGEVAARQAWKSFRDDHIDAYFTDRNRPDLDRTSRLSPYLHFGCIHPRTLLADIAGQTGNGARTFVNEIAWREFYADVLWHHPDSARNYLQPRFQKMTYSTGKTADAHFTAWTLGRTGYPMVDAGMRQLLAEGWMHNRVRMLVASFLVKDLHLEWTRGARWFMSHLVDADLASNQHGWQWVAGCGTDAAPYYRVFNPVLQGKKFDPDGDYVRRYVPELRDVAGGHDGSIHQPWALPDGLPVGYPARIVDHFAEREVALGRYAQINT